MRNRRTAKALAAILSAASIGVLAVSPITAANMAETAEKQTTEAVDASEPIGAAKGHGPRGQRGHGEGRPLSGNRIEGKAPASDASANGAEGTKGGRHGKGMGMEGMMQDIEQKISELQDGSQKEKLMELHGIASKAIEAENEARKAAMDAMDNLRTAMDEAGLDSGNKGESKKNKDSNKDSVTNAD